MSAVAQNTATIFRRPRTSCFLIGILCKPFSLTSALSTSPLVRQQRPIFTASLSSNKRHNIPVEKSTTRLHYNTNMSSSTPPAAADTTETCHHDSPFLDTSAAVETVLVILNSPIEKPPSLSFQTLWKSSLFRVCADGGANRLYDASNKLIPDAIRGDLDSLRQDVRDYYEDRGVCVEEDCNQDTNDLDKALQLIHARREEIFGTATNRRVCVYGAFGGRFDQEMGCIQALFNWSETFDNKLFLFDDNTCAFLLPAVIRNEIRLPFYGESPANEEEESDLIGEGPTCGLIPIGHRCEFVHTTGLKWNLEGSSLEFGGMVSTSNRAMGKVITVQASHPLVFTAEMSSGKGER